MKKIKMVSWNVNGLQAILKKTNKGKRELLKGKANALDYLVALENPDIICLQEIRCSQKFLWVPNAYPYIYANPCETKKGYSGTLIASKIAPLQYFHDQDGRIMIMEFPDWYLVNLYAPNTMAGPHRMNYRIHAWEPLVRLYINHIQASGKQVIICGDLNVIPTDDDMQAVGPIAGSSRRKEKPFFNY